MEYDGIIKALQDSKTDEDAISVMCAALVSITWGPDSPEMQKKRELVTRWAKMYLGQ